MAVSLPFARDGRCLRRQQVMCRQASSARAHASSRSSGSTRASWSAAVRGSPDRAVITTAVVRALARNDGPFRLSRRRAPGGSDIRHRAPCGAGAQRAAPVAAPAGDQHSKGAPDGGGRRAPRSPLDIGVKTRRVGLVDWESRGRNGRGGDRERGADGTRRQVRICVVAGGRERAEGRPVATQGVSRCCSGRVQRAVRCTRR